MSLLPTITDEDNVEIFEEDDDGEDDLMLGPASDEEEEVEEAADGETPKVRLSVYSVSRVVRYSIKSRFLIFVVL